MRKFTLYQASRYTKISRYKLEQAIEDGLLICTEGKGNVKCYIQEEHLQQFLDQHSDQYRRFSYPGDKQSSYVSDEIAQHISKDIHDQLISEKNRVISLLEFQNQQLMPMNDNNAQANMVKINELKSIAQMAIDELPSEKSSLSIKLKEQLNNIKL